MIEFDQDPIILNPFERRYSLSESLDIFGIMAMSDTNSIETSIRSQELEEVQRMRVEISRYNQEISRLLEHRNRTISTSVKFDVRMSISLQEAFMFIHKES